MIGLAAWWFAVPQLSRMVTGSDGSASTERTDPDDGSDHRWFEQRGELCTLLVSIDDATRKLMQLRFVPSKEHRLLVRGAERVSHDAWLPSRLLVRQAQRLSSEPARCERMVRGMTQFGRALAELNIEILCENSGQAKGRGESHLTRSPDQGTATSRHL